MIRLKGPRNHRRITFLILEFLQPHCGSALKSYVKSYVKSTVKFYCSALKLKLRAAGVPYFFDCLRALDFDDLAGDGGEKGSPGEWNI